MDIKDRLLADGLIGPFQLADLSLLDAVTQAVLDANNDANQTLQDRHTDIESIRNVFQDENLQAMVKHCFGAESKLWRSNFFVKKQGSGEVSWHHDKHFENGDQPIDLTDVENHFSLLIAVTDVDESGGVVEYLKGSHLPIEGLKRDQRPYHLRPSEDHFIDIPEQVLSRTATIPLKKGEFALFHSALLHRSLPFENGTVRISMIGRLTREHIEVPIALAAPSKIVDFHAAW